MRYVTATLGAAFMFIAVALLGIVVVAFLHLDLVPIVVVPLGIFALWTNDPLILVCLLLASLAAWHSYRSTLRHYNKKSTASTLPAAPTNPSDPTR